MAIAVDAEKYDWSRFSITFYYPVEQQMAYRSWATCRGLESFFIESAELIASDGSRRGPEEPAQAGDTFAWKWRHDATVGGRILEAEPDSLLAFTFGSMECRLNFRPAGPSSTMVLLEQSQIAADAGGRVLGHLNCRSCWVFFMTNLSSVYRTGTDLRDLDPGRVSSMEVGYEPPELTPG